MVQMQNASRVASSLEWGSWYCGPAIRKTENRIRHWWQFWWQIDKNSADNSENLRRLPARVFRDVPDRSGCCGWIMISSCTSQAGDLPEVIYLVASGNSLACRLSQG
jgi:hypothetical protein